ncbi:DNA polymerase III subunit delta' [Ferrimonas pelagia]|uniref:DNA-directed DNA polymerase n=1 Tax=Ferrimonas pelagia TaxID=1177826 RepID=A0ABP9F7U2_9GAMM
MMLQELPWLHGAWQQWLQSRQSGRLGHAVLLHGMAGLGKRELAEQMAAALLCEQGTGCGHCRSCTLLASGHHPDRIDLEPDGSQIKVDAVRALISQLTGTAHQGGARVVLIHHAQRMNGAAANALLKTLEEPMPGVYLVLLTHSPQQLLPTIASRCQRLKVPAATEQQLQQYLGGERQRLGTWPYWERLIGGPVLLKQWLETGEIDQIKQWRGWWRQSLKSGLLEPKLAAIPAESGAMLLKVLYFELLGAIRLEPERMARYYAVMPQIMTQIQWLERQSGVNLAAIFQRLLSQLHR